MDPNANLKEQLQLVMAIYNDPDPDEQALELAELVMALHEWLTKGGSLPWLWENR